MGPERALVDKRGVGLEQGSAGRQPVAGVVGGLDPARCDQHQAVAGAGVQPSQHRQRARFERRARQAAGSGRRHRGLVAQARAGDRRVGGDDAVEAEVERQVGQRVDVLVGQVRGDLDQQGDAPPGRCLVKRCAHRAQQGPQLADRLQVTQAGGVGRADVDHDVVGHVGHQPGAGHVIGHRALLADDLGLADIDPDDRPVTRSGSERAEPKCQRRRAVVVEPHPVDQRPLSREAKHPRLGVARLRLRGHRADLDETEPEGSQPGDALAVLVEPGRQPQRPGEVQPERPHPQPRVARAERPPQPPRHPRYRGRRPDQPERAPVGRLGRQPPQQHRVDRPVHLIPPSSPSPGSGTPYVAGAQGRRGALR
jgi:hypothetical protein